MSFVCGQLVAGILMIYLMNGCKHVTHTRTSTIEHNQYTLRVYVMNINDYSWANYTIRLFIAGFFDSFICTIIYLAAIVG